MYLFYCVRTLYRLKRANRNRGIGRLPMVTFYCTRLFSARIFIIIIKSEDLVKILFSRISVYYTSLALTPIEDQVHKGIQQEVTAPDKTNYKRRGGGPHPNAKEPYLVCKGVSLLKSVVSEPPICTSIEESHLQETSNYRSCHS